MSRKNVEDVYPLSAAQEGILFHSLYAEGTGVYVTQMSCRFRDLNAEAWERAWQEAAERHTILRTAFVWENLKRPLQVVGRQVQLPWERGDWRGLSAEEAKARLDAYLVEDRRRGFNFARAPVMRLGLFELEDSSHYFVWTHHHLILDGWSIFLIFKEVRAAYESLCRGERSALAPARPFRDYVAWLQRQDSSQAESFWRATLAGSSAPLGLVKEHADGEAASDEEESHVESYVRLSEEETEALRALARTWGLTLNVLAQGAWAVALGHCAGREDVCLGVTVSGRPPDLEGVETIAGLFINVLPLRVRVPASAEFAPWLRELQARQAEMRQYDYTPLSEMRHWADAPPGRPLFETILTWQNYPVDERLRVEDELLRVSEVRHHARNNYPLTVIASPRGRLVFQFKHDRRRCEPSTIERLRGSLETLLRSLAAAPAATLGELKGRLEDAERGREESRRAEREEASFRKFKSARPKKIALDEGKLFRTEYLGAERKLPLVVLPAVGGVDPARWASESREFIEAELLKHGALLFRGFDIKAVPDFERFASALCPELFGEYGDLPRAEVGGKVYGSTPYPNDKAILFHNESSHLHRWPTKICFFCVKAAAEGGETPIVDCREMFRALGPELGERFRRKGLMYVRNFVEGLDVSWRSFFRTEDRAAVERQCLETETVCEWTAGDGLRTRRVSPAVIEHPRTGETVFFNQLQLHHPGCLEPSVRESLMSVFGEESELPRNVFYGDGSPIEDEVMEELGRLYRRACVSFAWREGDVLLLDNMLTAHARNPFVGERQIVVAMGEMITGDALATAARI